MEQQGYIKRHKLKAQQLLYLFKSFRVVQSVNFNPIFLNFTASVGNKKISLSHNLN